MSTTLLSDYQKPALVVPGQSLSYSQLLQMAHGYGALIPEAAGGRVLLYSENRPEWVYSLYAIWQAGGTAVPVDFQATVDEVAFILADCRPVVLFCSAERRTVLEEACSRLDYTPVLHVFEELDVSSEPTDVTPIVAEDPEKTALLIYTSGTTGSPKGVMLSYTNLIANIEAVTLGTPIYTSQERVLMLLPLHHILPLLGTVILPLQIGATVALCPTLAAADILNTLQQNQVSIVIGVPRLYSLIMKSIQDKIAASKLATLLYFLAKKVSNPHFSRLLFASVHRKFGGHIKYLVSGGAALDPEVGQQFTTLGFEVLEGYGMTESAPMITFTRPGQVLIGSAGKAMSCTAIEIRDGEIVASGANIMQGYWNRPEETAEVLKGGWLYTGDLGYLDAEGRLFVTGRKKEIIVLANGKNINPALIEQELEARHPTIAEIGIFFKDDQLQAIIRPNLVLIREQGIAQIDAYFRWQVIDAYNKKASPAKRLHRFTLVECELPRTRLGKLKRFQLPELVSAREEQRSHSEQPQGQEFRILQDFLETQTSRMIAADDHLEIDAALDSLDKVSLLVFIKQSFGVEIAEEKLMQIPTLRQLATFIAERKDRVAVELINWREILKERVDTGLPRTWVTINWIKNCSRLLLGCYFRFRTEGREHIPDSPCIITPNHQSFIDGLLVAAGLKNSLMQRTCFYAKAKHLQNRWLRFVADRNNVVIMDIHADVRQSIQKVATLLQNGKNVIIFPEGTRTRNGALGEFKKTFAILSKELNVPVVPVAIRGAFEALPSGSLLPKPFRKISVCFQPPVFPEGHSYDSLKEMVHEQVQQCLVQSEQTLLSQGQQS
ncbi:AMP-binding protein [Desulfobulbus rhabdoformis]|uniref:AMP-binding protein n=1 Tax=Desulfobulbus rhabdoformis TaxID=34032 RepID=UPI00196588B5|nr:AMP-binding protein [Desulfobulbus rhabdoformis]MBM9613996.1 AMP-binding protein [Desulfobulbus rhabdoformis]